MYEKYDPFGSFCKKELFHKINANREISFNDIFKFYLIEYNSLKDFNYVADNNNYYFKYKNPNITEIQSHIIKDNFFQPISILKKNIKIDLNDLVKNNFLIENKGIYRVNFDNIIVKNYLNI